MAYNGQQFEYKGVVYKYFDPFCVKAAEKGTSNWYHYDTAGHIESMAIQGPEDSFYKIIAKGLGLQYERKEI